MANYYATSRSNYFKVKDQDKFLEWVESISGLNAWDKTTDDGTKLFGIFEEGNDYGGWPSSRWNDELNDYEDVDLLAELATHLDDEYIAVLISAGAEKLRYVTGYAEAVASTGEVETIALYQIYPQAQEAFGSDKIITTAEY